MDFFKQNNKVMLEFVRFVFLNKKKKKKETIALRNLSARNSDGNGKHGSEPAGGPTTSKNDRNFTEPWPHHCTSKTSKRTTRPRLLLPVPVSRS